jgi:hypothetical protein
MTFTPARLAASRTLLNQLAFLSLAAGLVGVSGCSSSSYSSAGSGSMAAAPAPQRTMAAARPSPDPRIGLKAGLFDAGEAVWNLRVLSKTPPSKDFVGITNSDLAFTDKYAIQGNYDGIQVWDISNPSRPTSVVTYVCPASQSDVSVYKNLLFVSGEGMTGRLDCGTEGVQEAVSHDRLRGIRIFDISDIRNPKYIANVQTCRGSHTHTVVESPSDKENVYIYVSGSAQVRPSEELPGCSGGPLDENPNSALFRIEVIKVPVAHPEQAAIVSSPRIFHDLVAPPEHGMAPADIAELEAARARGAFILDFGNNRVQVLPDRFADNMLDSIVKGRGGMGGPTAADSAALRDSLAAMVARRMGNQGEGPRPGPTQCHDITVYPAIGLAGGACGGYGLLLDISDPTNPIRIGAVSDSNFSYWHSATFNNDGTKILFTDEWGGGGQPKCRATDPKEWGADAIFTLENRQMRFRSYYKLPVAQTPLENCVAHNGSLLPIPGRDIMVQGWYQGGISVFDWTDPGKPTEIAFFDRGPVDPTRMQMGGSWSVYWYNGALVSSEIARGLDIFELTPSGYMSQNEIDAAKSVKLDHLNTQGQPKFVWPASFSLSRAYLDQLERSNGLPADRIAAVRQELDNAEHNGNPVMYMGGTRVSGQSARESLTRLASQLSSQATGSSDPSKVRLLANSIRELASGR